jgi:HSP20 family molecular chaperone IbpA
LLIDEEDTGQMPRLPLFNSPLLLGFEQFEEALERISKASTDGYPPYNVEQTSERHLRITLAVAGFAPGDLQVQVQDSQLTIRGRQQDEKDRAYLHRGIAARQFQRSFVLAEGIEVSGASLNNGLLHIELERPIVEPNVRTIQIDTASSGAQAIDTGPEAVERKDGQDAPG